MSDRADFGHAFADAGLRARALTHRSAGADNNERLEFLGDALLNLFVAELVFEIHPKATEGAMTRLRASLVNEAALAEVARSASLGDALTLGQGELKSGGFRRDSILADAFEALLAAIYLDGGWNACRDVVRRVFRDRVALGSHTPKDAKTRLQEWMQARGHALPAYELVEASGDDHAPQFDVVCRVDAFGIVEAGSAASRRAAEQIAAEHVLLRLDEQAER